MVSEITSTNRAPQNDCPVMLNFITELSRIANKSTPAKTASTVLNRNAFGSAF
ncbi:hypothetical protein AIOL_003182 [Candidatus Rhodobacter oscarellae]|uniref:Uncharacterized protein n=1 Tax=Candidatus Rhodobacter oscarellae TaxID=1675527 RepID=A0A0J9E6C1_9RHOB|nr:hypothetical protein AIOL_003182 [Candidatus Rhodobacter lobularis]